VNASVGLETRGFLVAAIRPPTVPVGTARLRVTLTAAHTDTQVDRLLDALAAQPGLCGNVSDGRPLAMAVAAP
jgi:8-amino-7-oxononanoate synthase